MMTTVDSAGRVVIPKAMRVRLGLHGGAEVEIEMVAGHVEIHPKGVDVHVEHRDDGPVLVPANDVPTLTTADVRRLVEEDRLR
ncbi:MAG: AbrB/MazE/SpoVT family DNA-binding domain-containing protein [Jiangellaceae bacterium]